MADTAITELTSSMKEAIDKFNVQEAQLVSLKQLVAELELKYDAIRHEKFAIGGDKTIGFTRKEEAKHFVDLCKSIFTQNFAMTKDLTEGTDSEGGYLVPLETKNVLLMLLNQYGVARPRCTVLPIAREELMMPKLGNGVQVYWIGEGAAITTTQPSFGEFRMLVKKLAALVPMTSEILADSVLPIANLLATLFAQAIAKEEDRVIFTGDTGAGDPFNGIFGDPNTVNFVMPAGETLFTDLTADMLADVTSTLPSVATEGAAFIMHRTVLNVIRKLKFSGTGEYIYSPSVQPGTPDSLWGYPVVLSEVMPTIADSAAGIPFIIFGNMRNYYIGDRMNTSIARSEHVGFANDKIYLRVIQREALACAMPENMMLIKTAAA